MNWKQALWIVSAFVLAALPTSAPAHNLPYSLSTIHVSADGQYELDINCHVAALIVGLPQAHLPPPARAQFAQLSGAEIQARIAAMSPYLVQAIDIRADGKRLLTPRPQFPTVAQVRFDAAQTPSSQAPSAPIVLKGDLPRGSHVLTLNFPTVFGNVLLHVDALGQSNAQALAPAETSQPIGVSAAHSGGSPGWTVTVHQYVVLGIEHIVPEGLDHILFVVSLFLLIPRLKPLAEQVTAFTVAHSVTLALAVFGIVTLPSRVVETMIAVSIAVVALDNLRAAEMAWWRPLVVFGFGFLHGLGFASVLKELGLPRGQEALALASFNVGIELGQFTVLAGCFLLLGWTIKRPWYRQRIVIPASILIAIVATIWAVQRAFFT